MGILNKLIDKYIGRNNLSLFLAMITIFVITFTLSIARNEKDWYISLSFLFIAVVVIPILNHFDKK